jgi:hypothetical protein
MKKIIAILVALSTLALIFVVFIRGKSAPGFFESCADISSLVKDKLETEEPTHDPTLPRTYQYNELNITLPAGFNEDSKPGVYKNGDYVVRCTSMAFSSITPNEGYEFPTLAVFMKEGPYFNETVVPKEQDGILYVDYETTASPSNISSVFKVQEDGMQCIMGFESDSAFYLVSFYSATLDYETVKAQAFEWAKTITFGE